MTTNKPGTVDQQPLYGCTSCYEEFTYPVDHLHVYDNECWCDLCWDERRWEFSDQPSWNELEPYTPALQAECDALRAKTSLSLGVGDGTGNLFVHGDYDSIKRVQALIFECEKLRKDAERYRYLKRGRNWIVAATQTGTQLDGEDLDDLIDREMEQQK